MRVAGEVTRGSQAVVIEQLPIAHREIPTAAVGQIMGRGRQIIGAMLLGHTAQAPQRRLQPRAQGLEALARADRYGLPVRVREHAVVQQMRKRLAGQRDLQLTHVGEIRLRLLARHVHLREEHLPQRSRPGAPGMKAPLQRTQLADTEAPGIAFVQLRPDRLGFQTAVLSQQRLNLRPHLDKWVRARPPGVGHLRLRRNPTRPRVLARCRVAHPRLGRRRHQRNPLV